MGIVSTLNVLARDRPHVVMGQKAKKPSKGAVKKEKEVEVPEVEEEAYVYPIWATAILWIARISAIMWILREAYTIRLYAINNYGRVIHEFDPWFNFRATQYLADNGYEKFFHWFDYMSWYPLGRPVGTTIYPGMQMTSVTIWKVMNATGFPMSLNDVCCFVPAWFGVVATTFLGLLTHECSGSINSGIFAAGIMAIIPAHIMRSVGGGYDNESIAVSAMCITFYFWCRSLRHYDASKGSWMIGAVAGVAHIYMAAVWGGYVFVINLIGLHAGMLALQFAFRKDFNETLHRSYSLFYIIGTIGATRVPVVGWTPVKSLEQMMPMLVFVGMQVLAYVEIQRKKDNLNFSQVLALRVSTPSQWVRSELSSSLFCSLPATSDLCHLVFVACLSSTHAQATLSSTLSLSTNLLMLARTGAFFTIATTWHHSVSS